MSSSIPVPSPSREKARMKGLQALNRRYACGLSLKGRGEALKKDRSSAPLAADRGAWTFSSDTFLPCHAVGGLGRGATSERTPHAACRIDEPPRVVA